MQPVSVIRAKLRPVVDALSAGSEADVGTLLTEMGVSRWDFLDLDNHPGIWGGDDWHWKLRRFRNGDGMDAWWKEAVR